MTKRIIYIIIALVVVAGAIFGGIRYAQARQAASSTANLQTVTVNRGTITTSVLATGNVRPYQTATLAWQTTGTVGQVNVKVGDVVTASQVLASLNPNSLPQSLITAQSNLETAQKNLDDLLNSQAPIAEAKTNLDNAQKALSDYSVSFPITQTQAQTEVISATQNLSTTTNQRNNLIAAQVNQSDLQTANQQYMAALAEVNIAQQAYDQMEQSKISRKDDRWHAVINNLNTAKAKLNAAFTNLTTLMDEPTAQDIAAADAKVAEAQAALAQSQSNLDRVKNGPDSTQLALLQAQVADAQRAYDQVKNGPDQAEVIAAKAQVAAAQAAVNQAKITAPFPGVVTEVDALPGDQVTSGSTAVRIDNLSSLLVDVQVSEVDIPNIKVDQPVKMTFDAIPNKEYNGKVTNVDMVGTSTQGVVQYGVTVQFTNADTNVKPGMTSSVSIVTQQKANVLMVPNRAVHVQAGQRYVIVLFEGNQEQVPVTVGLTNDTYSEITSGNLHEGDEVVIPSTTTGTGTNNRSSSGGGPGSFGP